MYIYHALINALTAHMIHINLNMIFYTYVEHSPTKTIYIKNYLKKRKEKKKAPELRHDGRSRRVRNLRSVKLQSDLFVLQFVCFGGVGGGI